MTESSEEGPDLKKLLEQLHTAVIQDLLDRFVDGDRPTTAEINAAIKLLAHNSIDVSSKSNASAEMFELLKHLPIEDPETPIAQ